MSGKNNERGRRNFIKATGAVGLALVAGLPLAMPAAAAASGRVAPNQGQVPVPGTQVFQIQVRGDLYSDPVDLDVIPGKLTDPFAVKGKGELRIRITPDKFIPR